jgi:hypothetical protein
MESPFPSVSAMPGFDTTVVGRHNNNGVIPYTGFFNSLQDTFHISIQFFQHLIVGRSVMPFGMSGVVGFFEADSQQFRFLFNNILLCCFT